MTPVESMFCRERLSLLVLLCALSTLMLFGSDRRHLSRPGHHSKVSMEHFAIARNLSPAHNFLMFKALILKDDGTIRYIVHNRFPIGGYVLIRLVILPFENDLAAQIHAARILLLLFFCAAVVLAYSSLRRLTPDPLVALTATLIAFSSYYSLYYNDMIYPKMSMDIFGVLLVFYGMVIFVQDGRFFQLPMKACTALLLGWHVLALLLPFIFWGLVMSIRKRQDLPSTVPTTKDACRHYVLLGGVTLLLSIGILLFNFTNEYSALNGKFEYGKIEWTKLESYGSMQRRLGMDPNFNARFAHQRAWYPYLEEEFRRLGQMALPYVVLSAGGMLDDNGTPQKGGAAFVIIGIAMSVACLIGLARGHSRMLLTSLAISGFCWSLPMRNSNAFHDYEALFYIGIPLIFFSQVCGWMQRRFGTLVMTGLAVAATLGFVLSSLQMSRVVHDAEVAEFFEKVMADVDVIRGLTKGKKVINAYLVPRNQWIMNRRLAVNTYLVGSIVKRHTWKSKENPILTSFDFIISPRVRGMEGANLLTPENRLVFLYETDGFLDAYRSRSFGRLLGRSNFEVYADGTVLRYVKSPCGSEDSKAPFFLHVFPADVEDLPDHRRQYSFDNLDFSFGQYRQDLGIDGSCEAAVALPEYPIARIRTGQYILNEGRIWEETFSLADHPLSSAEKESSPLGDHPQGVGSRP